MVAQRLTLRSLKVLLIWKGQMIFLGAVSVKKNLWPQHMQLTTCEKCMGNYFTSVMFVGKNFVWSVRLMNTVLLILKISHCLINVGIALEDLKHLKPSKTTVNCTNWKRSLAVPNAAENLTMKTNLICIWPLINPNLTPVIDATKRFALITLALNIKSFMASILDSAATFVVNSFLRQIISTPI